VTAPLLERKFQNLMMIELNLLPPEKVPWEVCPLGDWNQGSYRKPDLVFKISSKQVRFNRQIEN
jgi:hypothetical protein